MQAGAKAETTDDSSFDISLSGIELVDDCQPPLLTDHEILAAVGFGDLGMECENVNKKKRR